MIVTIPILLLLVVVAIAAQSAVFGATGSAAPSDTYVSYAMSVFLILFVLMIPVAAWWYFIQMRELAAERAGQSQNRAVRILVAVALAGLIVYFRHRLHFSGLNHLPFFHNNPGSAAKAGAGHHGHKASQTPQPHFEWWVLWVTLVAGVLLASKALYDRVTRRPAPLAATPVVEDELVMTISEAIDDLEREPDPRRAVIAAYARMERALGRRGLGRDRSETPLEYLRRVLLERTTAGGAVERLTSLFERAKFSPHAVTAAMKDDAISSLREIREAMAT